MPWVYPMDLLETDREGFSSMLTIADEGLLLRRMRPGGCHFRLGQRRKSGRPGQCVHGANWIIRER
jgi:hypothetical protein